jgi:hypothetical protein
MKVLLILVLLQLPLLYILHLGVQDFFGRTELWISIPSVVILLILYNIGANNLNTYLKALTKL